MENKGLKTGPISQEDLINKLVSAKKIMRKVDDGDFSRGHISDKVIIDENVNYYISDDDVDISDEFNQTSHLTPPTSSQNSEERILNSKLPNEIKEAMIKRPIANTQPTESFLNRTKKLMEQENLLGKKQPSGGGNVNELLNKLAPLIKKIVNEALDQKLEKILESQKFTSINENIAIKVGDSIFKGKITSIKS
jgi:hypothetical protein